MGSTETTASRGREGRRSLVLTLLFCGAVAATSATVLCAEGPSAAPSAPPAVAKTAPSTAPAAPAAPVKWLTDKEGRRYREEKLAKKGLPLDWLDEHHARSAGGMLLEVLRQDAEYLYIKIYDFSGPTREADQFARTKQQEAKAVEQEEIRKLYETTTPESDRVRFTDIGAGLPHVGQWRNGFVIADINHDGHPDIVHGPPRKGARQPQVFLGDGQGHWHPWLEAKFPPEAYDYGDVAVADWLNDGHLGLALGVHLKGLLALVGDGKGNFKPYSKGLPFATQQEPAPFTSRTLGVLDVNGDGRPDILALGEGPRLNTSRGPEAKLGDSHAFGLVAYINGTDGIWKLEQISADPQLFGDHIAVADFNGDGRPDIAISSGAGGKKDLVYLAQPEGGFRVDSIAGIRPGSYVTAIAAADFDHDGRADLAVGYLSFEGGVSRTAIDIFYSRPGGVWERRVLAAEEGIERIGALATGDLDGDHSPDLVALTGQGKVWVFLGDGKGFFVREDPPELAPLDKKCAGYHVALADLDGDGRDEIVAGFAGEPSPMHAPDECVSGGNLRAWKAQVAAPGKAGS